MEKLKLKKASKGIETMFRITASNHQRLSAMADNKAHIMISVNSIILSAILSLVLRRIEEYPGWIIPTIIILSVNVATLIFAVLATRPGIAFSIFSKKQLRHKKVNLLFFGNFYHIPLHDYKAGMISLLNDEDFLYTTLIEDIYTQGLVLSRKYHLLRIAYSIFMYGIIFSVGACVVVTFF